MHTAAREMVYVAEQGLMADGKNTLDPTWQEMLNHATAKVRAGRRRRNKGSASVPGRGGEAEALSASGQRGGGGAAAQREGAHARHARLPGGRSSRADAAEVPQESHRQVQALL